MKHFTLPQSIKNCDRHILEKLEESIQNFSNLSGIPVTFFDNQGQIQWEYHKQNKLCSFFENYHNPQSACLKNLISSAKLAAQLGEPYVFVCKTGLVKIGVSLIVGGQNLGCFLAGPILMGGLKESVIDNLISLNSIQEDAYPKLIVFLRDMKSFQPKEVSYLSSLLGSCILASITPNSDYSRINNQYKEQRRIGENLQKYKRENMAMPYPYELESKLIEAVKDGNTRSCLEAFEKLLSELSMIEAGDLSSIKTKVLSICSILSRIAAEKNNLSPEESERFFDELNFINQTVNFQELSVQASNLIQSITQTISEYSYSGNSQIIKLAIQNINENFKNKLPLKTVAGQLHTNPSYLSTLFRQETGLTFTDYLNRVRINHSCELLRRTNLNLIEISIQSGFGDQSYFTKVFKKMKGTTPKDFKKVHRGFP